MEFTPRTHKFNAEDIFEIREAGYDIEGIHESGLEQFINTNFEHFDLCSLVRTVELHFTHTTDKKIHRKLLINEPARKLVLDYRNEFTSEDNALLFVREFYVEDSGISINHLYCVLPVQYRGKGHMKPVFQESIRQYINMRAKKILVHAGLSGGGLVWAKCGFTGVYKHEIQKILERAENSLQPDDFHYVKFVFEKYYSENNTGAGFPLQIWAAMDCMKPVLLGSDWHGELDLTNPAHLRNFINYVSRP
jgi:hypothetical protein